MLFLNNIINIGGIMRYKTILLASLIALLFTVLDVTAATAQ